MKKEIKSRDGKLLIEIDNSGYVQFISIKKVYINDTGLQKIITFSMWDDFQFNAYSKDNDNELSLEFENDDYLYSNLSILLGKDKEIVIDDDNTLDKLKKFMSIIKKDKSIVITFHVNVNSEFNSQKYSVFIKNIGPDARSKIQNSDLKIRLIELFENCKNFLLKEVNQISEEDNSRVRIKK